MTAVHSEMVTKAYCPTCRVSLSLNDKRLHTKTEWHVYNLKRLVATLPPLSEADFAKKQAFFLSVTCGSDPSSSVGTKKHHCKFCKKSFNSQKSYDNHLASKQHRVNTENFHGKFSEFPSTQGASVCHESDDEKNDSDEGTSFPLPIGACLFCDRIFQSEEAALEPATRVMSHMLDVHRFQLPYPDKLIDPIGLLADLGRLVGQEYACLACGRQFLGRTHGEIPVSARERRRIALAAVRAHMRDAEHMHLFCGTSDPVQIALAVAEAEDKHAAEFGLESGPMNPEKLPAIARPGGELYSQFYKADRIDNTLVIPEVDENAFELHLPTGGVLGHRRFYQTVYRQNLLPLRSASETRQREMALTHTSCCVPLAIAARQANQNNNTGIRTVAAGEGKLAKLPKGRLSRMEAHHQATIDKYNLDLSMRGNFFLRGHLRRQY